MSMEYNFGNMRSDAAKNPPIDLTAGEVIAIADRMACALLNDVHLMEMLRDEEGDDERSNTLRGRAYRLRGATFVH